MVIAVCLCADKRILSSYSEDLYSLKNNFFKESYATFHFLWSQVLRMISYIDRV